MQAFTTSLMASLAILLLSAPAQAAVIFQSVENLAAKPDITTLCTACNGRYRAYEGVRLGTDAAISSIDLVVRAFDGACCFYDDHFTVAVYDGTPDNVSAPLLYAHEVFAFGSSHAPQDRLTAPGILTGFESAIVNAPTPDLMLRKDHDYTFSFFAEDFHIAVFRSGISPLYQDLGPAYGYGARDRFAYGLSNGATNVNGAAGFRLNGEALASPASVPEPASWTIMILGLTAAGAVTRRRAHERRVAAGGQGSA